MLVFKNKTICSFRSIALFGLFSSLFFILLWGIRFFQIDTLLKFLPETIREMFDKSPIWVFYAYFLSTLTNLITAILLLRRAIFVTTVAQLSAGAMLLFISYHFFSKDYIGLYEAIEMLATLLFCLFWAWFAKYAGRNGYLSKFSKHTTTVSLNIQEGCNHECSYCPIPIVRGNSRSDSLINILANAKGMAAEGIKDIVLVGDNIGDFGTGEKADSKHSHSFYDLLEKLDQMGGVERFSFQSITSPLFSDKTLNFIKQSKRFTPHFSVTMGSGSEEMMKKMNRPFPLSLYKDLFLNIKRINSVSYIGVEVVIGFPGETDALFNETFQFLSASDISCIKATMYSKKKGTKAFRMRQDLVSKAICKKRKKLLLELSKKKLQVFYETQLSKEKTVLFENTRKGNYIHGFTENHIKVKCIWNRKLGNTIHEVKLTGINGSFMLFDFVEKDHYNSNESYVHI
ncbi:MAG: MiaB/RimO family radical SAM methylthiotransferase [Polaribacter sp.]|jgi:MiaB/RimO family radical SAM methylthiotransferase